MVDVGDKDVTRRVAVAEGWIVMQPATLERIVAGAHAKGDVLGVARIAGIMGAKRTADLIPLCHPLALDPGRGRFGAATERSAVRCQATVETHGAPGWKWKR
jgi:cyclic pyranopterin phosphate synthase